MMTRKKRLRLAFLCAGKQCYGMTREIGPAGFIADTSVILERGARIVGHLSLDDGTIVDFAGRVRQATHRQGLLAEQVPGEIAIEFERTPDAMYTRFLRSLEPTG